MGRCFWVGRGWYLNAHYESCAKVADKLISYFKMTRISWILIWALETLKNLHFDWFLCAKYTTFDLKKYKRVYFMTLKSHAKFEEKLTCGLENDIRNLANFHQNIWKCQNWSFHWILLFKVENTWATNLQKWNWLIVSELTQGIWWILTWGLEGLKNLHFNGLLLTTLYNFEAKKVQRSYV